MGCQLKKAVPRSQLLCNISGHESNTHAHIIIKSHKTKAGKWSLVCIPFDPK